MKKKKLDACTKIFSVCDMIHYEHLERKEEKEGRRKKGRERRMKLTFMELHIMEL